MTEAPNTSENPIDIVQICHENISEFRNIQELFQQGLVCMEPSHLFVFLTWFTFYVSCPQILGQKLLTF